MAGKAGRRIYGTARWKALRGVILKRDGFRCRLCHHAGRMEVDHVKPIADGGEWFDPGNLRAICRTCHIQRRRDEAATTRANASPARARLRRMANAEIQ